MPEYFTLVPASYVFLVRDGQVLLQLRQNTGYADGHWSAGAAGHIEFGEDALDGAVREAREELNVTIDRNDLVPVAVMQRTDGTDDPIQQRVDWFFAATRWQDDPVITEPVKCAALEWFALDDLPELVPAHERQAIAALAAGARSTLLFEGFED